MKQLPSLQALATEGNHFGKRLAATTTPPCIMIERSRVRICRHRVPHQL